MFKLPVLLALVVASTTMVLASPSAPPVERAPACRDHGSEAARLCEDRLTQAMAPLHTIIQQQSLTIQQQSLTIQQQAHTIQQQAHTLQVCMQPPTTPQTTPAPLQSSADTVTAMIADLRQTVERLPQAIVHSWEQSATLSTTPAPSPATNETNILHDVIVNLTNVIQQQHTTPLELMSTLRNMTMTSSPTDCGHESGYTYNNETKSCYKHHAGKMKWTEANDICVREGAHLAVINGRREASILGDMVKLSGYYPFIGYRRDSVGVWRAVTGETVEEAATFSPWGQGYPRNDTDRMYALIRTDGTLVNWGDIADPFICEKRPH